MDLDIVCQYRRGKQGKNVIYSEENKSYHTRIGMYAPGISYEIGISYRAMMEKRIFYEPTAPQYTERFIRSEKSRDMGSYLKQQRKRGYKQ